MVGSSSLFDCSPLGQQNGGFKDYVIRLRNQTGFNTTLLAFCDNEICGALWGVGNPDVSGIGVISAYVIEVALGFLLSLGCYVSRHQIDAQPWNWCRTQILRPAERGLESFLFSAVYFAMSVLVATSYSLAKRDFDISADGFGMLEVNIASAVAVTSVLPLLYPMTMGLPNEAISHSHNSASVRKAKYNLRLRRKYGLVLLGITVTLFMYPFVSQCTHNWAPSDIGEGSGPGGITIITSAEWAALTHTCFGEVDALSYTETIVIAAFELAGSLTYILVSMWVFITPVFRRLKAQRLSRKIQSWPPASAIKIFGTFTRRPWVRQLGHVILLLFPLSLCIPLILGIFKLRKVQKSLATVTANAYIDNEWGFGQVVAIVVFAPVLLDMMCSCFELD